MRTSLTLAALLILALPWPAAAVPGQPLNAWKERVRAFDTAKLPAHPRLLLTPTQLERVRRAAREPFGGKYWQVVRRYTDAERGKPVPPSPAGFPESGWNIDDWRRLVNAGGDAQNHILAYSFAWLMERKPEDLAEAKRWALGVCAWDPHGPTAIEGVDHAAHDVLHALAMAWDWLYDEWTPEERDTLRRCMLERGRGLYKHLNPYRYDSWNNHAWFQTTALAEAGLALADEVPEADTWWRFGSDLYFTEFLPLGGRDGDWHEGTHYVSYTLIFVYQWADCLLSATGIDAYTVPWLKDVGYFRLYTAPPTGGGIHFNDNNVRPPDGWDRMTAWNAARTTRDPVLQWYAEAMSAGSGTNPNTAMYALVYRDGTLKPAPPGPDLPQARLFRDSGWVVVRTDLSRSDDVQFGLKAGPWFGTKGGGKGHDHPDQGSYLINYLAEPLVADSGYYDWYGSPHHKGWTFTPRAHNTFVIGGAEQLVGAWGADGRIVSFVSENDGMTFVEAELSAAYPEGTVTSWRRQALFVPPDTFVVRDVVAAPKAATLEYLLHGPGPFRLDGQSFQTRNSAAGLAGRIVTPEGLNLRQWGGFPPDAQPERKKPGDFPDQWHLTATTPEARESSVFVTVLRVGRGEAPVPAARWTGVDGSDSVLVRSGGVETAVQAFSGLPSSVALTASSGPANDRRLVLVRATKVGGKRLLWRSHQPADVSGRLTDAGWTSLTVSLPRESRVRFAAAARVSSLRVNGRETPCEWDKETLTVALTLPAGLSRVTTGPADTRVPTGARPG